MGSSKKLWLITWLIAVLLVLFGCAGKQAVKQYLSVDGEKVYENEVMLYLLQTYNEFEELGGSEVWEISDFSGGKSASDVAKQGAIDNLIMTKVLVEKAVELGLSLDETTRQSVEDKSVSYFESLEPSFVERYGVTQEVVRRVLIDNKIAVLVEASTKGSYEVTTEELGAKLLMNEEYNWLKTKINDGIETMLSVYTIEHIVTYTHEKDSSNLWMPLSQEKVELARKQIEEAEAAVAAGMSFEDALLLYTQDPKATKENTQSEVALLQLPDVFSDSLSVLEVGDISDIIVSEYGYHLFKVVDKVPSTAEETKLFNESFKEWEQALFDDARKVIVDEAFDELYDKWSQNVKVVIEDVWSEVDILTITD